MPMHQQNPDGSWSPAQPLGFVPGLDWEVYPHHAIAYRGNQVQAEVRSRRRWLLWARIITATVLECGWRPGERIGILR